MRINAFGSMSSALARQRISSILVLLFLAFLAAGSSALAQSTINGQVVDPSGAAVVNAQTTLTDGAGQAIQHATTNASGQFSFPSVAPGTYTLTVEAIGFAQYQQAAFTM